MTTRTPQIHLFGNLGGDPETKTLPGRTFNRDVYDAILDDAIEKEYTTPDREILVASLAVNYRAEDGTPQRAGSASSTTSISSACAARATGSESTASSATVSTSTARPAS